MFFYLEFRFYFEATGPNFFTRVSSPLDPRAIRAALATKISYKPSLALISF